ncbi:hypothetical protein IWX90DRAFT_406312 [Phyllosticta citrichinensis]|uniref:Uncharacterized protein n=1 Tax=Phyllosticta citrichinensis TaxID=1130410 RepID=A0ABR1XKF1_9PEZI
MAVAPPPYMTQLIGQAQLLATHSWEWGTLSQALLEWYDPQYSVFADNPFPNASVPRTDPNDVAGLRYATRHIYLDDVVLADGDGSSADPASLGVSAVLLGAVTPSYRAAAQRQYEHLVQTVPRWPNGAISHREGYAELWADFVSMVPPFLAYYAVAAGDAAALAEAGRQVELYGDVLASRRQEPDALSSISPAGLWRHIVGPVHADPGLWSTGNAWTAHGAARVLATINHARPFLSTSPNISVSFNLTQHSARLATTIKRILDAAICLDAASPPSPLLRNYLNDSSWFGDAAGTALLAAAAYRAVVLDAALFPPERYAAWAHRKREAVDAVVDRDTGIVGQGRVVNPLDWGDRVPAAKSPEAQSFAVMLFAAYRDYVAKMGGVERR